MNIGDAIEALKIGNRVSRSGWVQSKVWLEMAPSFAAGDPPEILAICYGKSLRWPAPHEDLFAEDWFIPAFAEDWLGAF